MANRIELEGLDEFKAMLQALPETLANEASEIVDHYAEITAASLRQLYPIGDRGNLRKGIKIKVERGRFAVGRTVRSSSAHAHLWEFGTQNRFTRRGWRRGRELPHEGLVSIAIRNRKRMIADLIELVKRRPFEVTTSGV